MFTQTQALPSAPGSRTLWIMRPWSRDPSARVAESGINLPEPRYTSQNVNYAPHFSCSGEIKGLKEIEMSFPLPKAEENTLDLLQRS